MGLYIGGNFHVFFYCIQLAITNDHLLIKFYILELCIVPNGH